MENNGLIYWSHMNNKTKRNHSGEFKAKVVLEYLRGEKSQAEICRENIICPSLFNKWLKQFENNVTTVFEKTKGIREAENTTKLEQIIGKQTIEIDFLKRGLQMFGH